jgi:sporulation-control protein spo0M
MRGISIQKPFEISIDVQGEQWSQNQITKGTLTVKNMLSDEQPLQNIGVCLAYADLKKVKNKNADCFKVEQNILFPHKTIKGKECIEIPFEFQLSENCPITDKTASYFLSYGNIESHDAHLQLLVNPKKTFLAVVEIMDLFFRFKLKEQKYSKGRIEFKFTPSSGREFANIQDLLICMHTEGETLKMEFIFNTNKLSGADVGLGMKLTKTKLSDSLDLTARQYLFQKDMINQELLKSAISTVLEKHKNKVY